MRIQHGADIINCDYITFCSYTNNLLRIVFVGDDEPLTYTKQTGADELWLKLTVWANRGTHDK